MRILFLLSFAVVTALADYNQEWSYDFSSQSPYLSADYKIEDIALMSGDRVAVIVYKNNNYPEYGSSNTADGYLCILDKDGVMLKNYYFNSPGLQFLPSHNPRKIILQETSNSNGYNVKIFSSTADPAVFDLQVLSATESVRIKTATGILVNKSDGSPVVNPLLSAYEYKLDIQPQNMIQLSHKNTLYFKEGTLVLCKYRDSSVANDYVVRGGFSSGFTQDNYVINWDSYAGSQYQIQTSTNLIDWDDIGSPIVGNGQNMSWANHVTNSQAFYRIVER